VGGWDGGSGEVEAGGKRRGTGRWEMDEIGMWVQLKSGMEATEVRSGERRGLVFLRVAVAAVASHRSLFTAMAGLGVLGHFPISFPQGGQELSIALSLSLFLSTFSPRTKHKYTREAMPAPIEAALFPQRLFQFTRK
jgi:hypothetical protein